MDSNNQNNEVDEKIVTVEQDPNSSDKRVVRDEKKSSLVKELINFALIVILIILPIRLFIAQPFVVVGTSMEPTFLNNEYLIIDELTYKLSTPQRGDVVVFKYDDKYGGADGGPASDPTKFFIKRVIGLPGETVDIKNNTVTIINAEHPEGFVLNEPYIKAPPTNTLTVHLDPGTYFVMGDNRDVSFDSRSWGPLAVDKMVGRVLVRLLPPQKASILPGSNAGKY